MNETTPLENYFKVIIAGSRTFTNLDMLCKKCDYLLQNKSNIQIVSGTAKGADRLGEQYARINNYSLILFPADWDRFGKKAGFIRNKQMAEYADALMAFWDGESKGTEHMISAAKSLGKIVKIIYI